MFHVARSKHRMDSIDKSWCCLLRKLLAEPFARTFQSVHAALLGLSTARDSVGVTQVCGASGEKLESEFKVVASVNFPFMWVVMMKILVVSVIRPNRALFVHPVFPVFEPHIQKWVIFVRRCPRVCDTFRSPPISRKRSILLPNPSSTGLRQLTFPNVKNDRAKTTQSVFFENVARPATPSQEHGLCPPLGFNRPFC